VAAVWRRYADPLRLGPEPAWVQGAAAGDRGVEHANEGGVDRAPGVIDDELRHVTQVLQQCQVGPRGDLIKTSRAQEVLERSLTQARGFSSRAPTGRRSRFRLT
jgi:hypothetical protein